MHIFIDAQSPIIKVDQYEFAKKIAEEFGSGNSTSSKYPSDIHLFEDSPCDPGVDKTTYLSLTMSLMYLATRTRPDIVKEVAWLATKASNPSMDHMKKLYKVLNYINGTLSYGLTFDGDSDLLEVYADASFAVHMDTFGHTGIIIKLLGV